MARGAFDHLLVPEQESADAELVERVELEDTVELLEPLLFLMSRALENLTQRAGERALAIASVESCLVLDDAAHSEHRRTVRPALPERDYHTLLKLIQLDFELHPPPAGIVAFTLRARPARAQKGQQGLFAAQAPEPGRLEVLLARLRKLVGEGRVGAPELLDTHAPEGFRVTPFAVPTEEAAARHSLSTPYLPKDGKYGPPDSLPIPHSPKEGGYGPPRITSTLRMMRPPLAVGIGMNGAVPANLFLEGKRFALQRCSGPWRTSGAWWKHPAWCREEWDVVVSGELVNGKVVTEAAGKERPRRCLRLAHDPGAGGYGPTDGPPTTGAGWYVLGIYDLVVTMYVELHARSAFSFLEGASLPELLMARCAQLDMPAMALLDRNGLYGSPRFHMAAVRAGARAHMGAEIAVVDAGERVRPPRWLPHRGSPEPVRWALLAETQTGYQNLCRLITLFKLREAHKAEGGAGGRGRRAS